MLNFYEYLREKWTIDISFAKFGKPEIKKIVPIYENPTSSDLVQLTKDGLSYSRKH